MIRVIGTAMGVILALGSANGIEPELTHDWPRIFGPSGDSTLPAQPFQLPGATDDWPVAWSLDLGESYAGPSIVGNKLIVYHRLADDEILECIDVETRASIWRHQSPTQYLDQYGYNNGPRATPVIADDVVYALGAEGKLHSLDLKDGRLRWTVWLNRDFRVSQDFFGVAGSPLVLDDQIVLNVGGKGASAVGLDPQSGKAMWSLGDDGPSYATPVSATIHGRRIAFVFTKGGLLAVDMGEQKLLWNIPFRSKLYESVNASTPIVVGDTVFVSATYGTGSLCLRIKPDGQYEELWRSTRAMDSHFSNLIHVDGTLYGFAGRHESDCELRAIDLKTGKILWSVSSLLGRGSMIKVGDHFFLWGERGHLLFRQLRPEAPPELPENPRTAKSLLSYPCWTPPALAGGRLYLRNERKLIAIDLRVPR
ncbi:PQQ-like beta-propeller repeat protein [bacterium]|nr:PQQ-like beta-propeller repeat protein [bacterium]